MAPSTPKALENGSTNNTQDPNPATVASFSPAQPIPTKWHQPTIMVHQKSPLLIATPPQITRALAFSHPFLLPLDKSAGLVTWTSGDPWESFLLVAGFWAVVLYGDAVIRWSGPILVVTGLIVGMYSRRYSPLSSSGWTGEKLKGYNREQAEGNMRHQKSLDEIVDTLNVLTSRCSMLLDPLLQLTDFLSTQRTATSATTRPALTTLFLRILMITPLWIALTLPPLHIITTRRVILAVGTLMLSWHSRPARVSRTILWRSLTVRHIVSVVTGLTFINHHATMPQNGPPPPLPPRKQSQHEKANTLVANEEESETTEGVRFTFVLYENQRRWLGLGWTSSLFAYERSAWTDEHLNPSPPKDEFQLPAVDNEHARWRWVKDGEWRVEGAGKGRTRASKGGSDEWIYYDNKWNDGRRGQDGWGRYTRRRKWYRDAELVDVTPGTADPSTENMTMDASVASNSENQSTNSPPSYSQAAQDSEDASSGQTKRRGFLRRGSRASAKSSSYSGKNILGGDEDNDHRSMTAQLDRNGDWGVGDDVKMALG